MSENAFKDDVFFFSGEQTLLDKADKKLIIFNLMNKLQV